MRLDQTIHLDYADVLLKPKRSTLSSRKEVDMTRNKRSEVIDKLAATYILQGALDALN